MNILAMFGSTAILVTCAFLRRVNKNSISFFLNISIVLLLASSLLTQFKTLNSHHLLALTTYLIGAGSMYLIYFQDSGNNGYEKYTLATLLVTACAELILSKFNLLSIYVLLEFQSITSAILISGAFKHRLSSEAGIRYVIFSAIMSVIFLLGCIMLYANKQANSLIIGNFASVMILLSLGARLGIFPFQAWFADIYSGTHISTMNIINTLPKISICSLVYTLFNESVLILNQNTKYVLLVFSLLGVTIATIRCISQTDIRRLIAYSGAVNFGILYAYLLLYSNSTQAHAILKHYLVAYAVANLLLAISSANIFKENEGRLIQSNNPNAVHLFCLMAGFISMLGMPPFLGFFAKLDIMNLALANRSQNLTTSLFTIPFIITMSFSTILGAYYYVNLPMRLILEKFSGNDAQPSSSKSQSHSEITAILISLALLLGFLFK